MLLRTLFLLTAATLALAGILFVAACSSGGGGTVDPDPVAEILLDKQGSLDLGADEVATPGDLITYTFDVTNTGDVTLTEVTVSDPSVADLDCGAGTSAIGTLEAGVTTQCSGTYPISEADIDAGAKVNTAVVEGTDPDGEPVEDEATHTEPVGTVAEILLEKQGSLDLGANQVPDPGDLIHYVLDVTNTGDVRLTEVTVSDPSVADLGCGAGTNTIGTLESGATTQCAGTYAISQADIAAGQKVNTAVVEGMDPDGGQVADEATHVEVVGIVAEVLIEKQGSLDAGADGVANPGDPITYTIDVTNTGNVTLTDLTVSDPSVSNLDCGGGTNSIGTLEFGATTQCSGTYELGQADIDAGRKVNTATVTGTGPNGESVEDEAMHVETVDAVAEILLEKQGTLDLGEDGVANPGDRITYTIDVTNTGNVTLTGVAVFDLSVSDLDCGAGTNAIGTMAPGETAQCAGTYAITLTDVDAGQRVNTAVVSGEDPNGGAVGDEDTHTTVVPFVALPIAGEYAIDVQVVSDTCGFGASPGSLVMNVVEQGADLAEVDIPIGGAGGICAPRNYVRVANTLTLTRTTESQSGDCLVRSHVTTFFEFFDDDSVTGSETNSYSEIGGDCSQLQLPCEIVLSAEGARCSGCYDCTPDARARPGLMEPTLSQGPLAAGATRSYSESPE